MAKMLLVNPTAPPSKRRAKPKTARRGNPVAKRRTAKQKAATRKLVALNRAKRAIPRGAKRRRKNPIVASRVGSRRGIAIAPKRRRNPIRSAGRKDIMSMLKHAGVAASGAIVLDYLWHMLTPYIPAAINVGAVRYAAKAAGAVGMGMIAGKVVNKQTAHNMTLGALTVVLHDAARNTITSTMPSIQLDGMGYYNAGLVVNGMGQYLPPAQMGEYVNGSMNVDRMAAMAGYGENYYG